MHSEIFTSQRHVHNVYLSVQVHFLIKSNLPDAVYSLIIVLSLTFVNAKHVTELPHSPLYAEPPTMLLLLPFLSDRQTVVVFNAQNAHSRSQINLILKAPKQLRGKGLLNEQDITKG